MAELDRAGISVRMAQARETAGLTQPQIAELLEPKVHFRTVQDWESPKKNVVPFDRLDEWARLTNSSREWLLYGEERVTETSRLRHVVHEEVAEMQQQIARILVLLQEPPRSHSETS